MKKHIILFSFIIFLSSCVFRIKGWNVYKEKRCSFHNERIRKNIVEMQHGMWNYHRGDDTLVAPFRTPDVYNGCMGPKGKALREGCRKCDEIIKEKNKTY